MHFQLAASLTAVTIPNSVTTIGGHAFSNCTKLVATLKQTDPSKITLEKSREMRYGTYYYGYYNFKNVKQIKVPMASLDTYKAADGWKDYKSIMVGYN